MPSALASPDVVARAVLEKAPASAPSPTREQLAAAQLKQKMKEGTRSATESMQQRPVDRGEKKALTEKNIGIDRNADGSKKRTGEVKRRFEQAEKYRKLSEDILEKGYDNLDATQKSEANKLVESAVNAWPEGAVLLSSVPNKADVIETILRNPDYVTKLRSVFEQATNPSTTIEDVASDLKAKLEEAKAKEAAKKAEIARSNGEKGLIDAQLEQFEDRTSTGGAKGTRLTELEDLQRELPTLTKDLTGKQDQFEETKDRIRDLENIRTAAMMRGGDTTVLDGELTGKRNDKRKLQTEINEINEKVGRKNSLEEERNGLRQRRQQLEVERNRLDEEMRALTQERVRAQGEFASEKLTRDAAEQDFVDGLTNAVSEATMQYLEGKIQTAEQAQQQLLQEEIAKTGDPDERIILNALDTRYDKRKNVVGRFGGRRQIIEYNKRTIEGDFSTLVTKGGPREIARAMLIEGGLSPAEADLKVSDPEFMAKMGPTIVEKLVRRKVQTGKISEVDARVIVESDWGQGAIEAALQKNTELKGTLEKLKEQGALQGGLVDWIRNRGPKGLLALLALLFGAGFMLSGPGGGLVAAGALGAVHQR